jgi:hypothetical protein
MNFPFSRPPGEWPERAPQAPPLWAGPGSFTMNWKEDPRWAAIPSSSSCLTPHALRQADAFSVFFEGLDPEGGHGHV